MSAAPTLAELRHRRERLATDLSETIRRRVAAEDAAFAAERRRHAREAAGPDTEGAHLAGYVRDLVRTLQDAQAQRTKAWRESQQLAARLERMAARRRALEGILGRLARAAGAE